MNKSIFLANNDSNLSNFIDSSVYLGTFLIILIIFLVLTVIVAKKTRFLTTFLFLITISSGLAYLVNSRIILKHVTFYEGIGLQIEAVLSIIVMPLTYFHLYFTSFISSLCHLFLDDTSAIIDFLSWENYYMLIIYAVLFLLSAVFFRKKKRRVTNFENSRYND